jgi:calcineurin-like phosphoesterase family protein
MIWYTADQHFGHTNIIQHMRRPFANAEEMAEGLIRRHNQRVRPSDTVYMLGDIAYRLPPRHLAKYLSRMNGKKKLLYGNHDRKLLLKAVNKGVLDILLSSGRLQLLGDYYEQMLVWRDKPLRIVLCHYPIHNWNCKAYGSWHVHAHSHGTLGPHWRRMDCGVDCWDYYPVSFEEIVAAHDKQTKEAGTGPITGINPDPDEYHSAAKDTRVACGCGAQSVAGDGTGGYGCPREGVEQAAG